LPWSPRSITPSSCERGPRTMRSAGLVFVFALLSLGARAAEDPSTRDLLKQASAARDAKRWDEALERSEAALKVQPRNADAWDIAGYANLETGRLAQAEECFRQAVKLKPLHTSARFGLARVVLDERRYEDAAERFGQLRKDSPDYCPFWARNNLGYALYQLGRYDEAAKLFDEALKDSSERNVKVWLNAVGNEFGRRNYRRALEISEQATRAFPQDPWVWHKLGWAHKYLKENAQAHAAFQKARELAFPDKGAEPQIALALPFRGCWKVTQGNRGEVSHEGIDDCFAWDFQAVDNDANIYVNKGKKNTDYASFGREIIAPADGTVIYSRDGIRDNEPGEVNPTVTEAQGNAVHIQQPTGEVLRLYHFQKGSVRVKVGEKVKRGDCVGLCGNSGLSDEPHLHFGLVRYTDGNALSCPCCFSSVWTGRGENRARKEKAVPQRGEFVENEH
ncbi:MAG: tetratricopeptide repeat protein, partial [Planctomycetota bacterium]|nr:tetratricopeptide repeat protein [Planctomycetota bacterium]